MIHNLRDVTDDDVLTYAAAHPGFKVAEPRLAYVNHGRWVADCRLVDPLTGDICGGAELVTLGEDMLCGGCNQQTPVVFPPATKRKEIDRLLAVRPNSRQHWNLDDDVAVLIGENIAVGLEK